MTIQSEGQEKRRQDEHTELGTESAQSPYIILKKIDNYRATTVYDYNNSKYMFKNSEQENEFYNTWADYWRYVIGVNIIPADTRNKTTFIRWKQYQNSPISELQHQEWKRHYKNNHR